MEAYSSFAQVYDVFMDNIPYDEWCKYVVELLRKYNIDKGIVLELGCGTGSVTRRIKRAGYDMIGIDNSEEMLSLAKVQGSEGILYLLQDMTEFELYGTVNAVISICDSINYVIEEEELLSVFKLVNNYLEKDGIFIFDLNTEYKYKELMGDNIIAENREEGSFIWENTFYEDEAINEYNLTLYIRDKDNRYNRFEEVHYQRAYTIEKVKELLEKAGMEYITAYDAFTYNAPTEQSERVYIIAKEGFQKDKKYVE